MDHTIIGIYTWGTGIFDEFIQGNILSECFKIIKKEDIKTWNQ